MCVGGWGWGIRRVGGRGVGGGGVGGETWGKQMYIKQTVDRRDRGRFLLCLVGRWRAVPLNISPGVDYFDSLTSFQASGPHTDPRLGKETLKNRFNSYTTVKIMKTECDYDATFSLAHLLSLPSPQLPTPLHSHIQLHNVHTTDVRNPFKV